MSDEERKKWDQMWSLYERDMAAEFLCTNRPLELWDRLQAARDFKNWAEGLENEQS